MFYNYACLLFILNVITFSSAIEPITTASGIGAIFVGVGVAYNYARCLKEECCDDTWIKFDLDGLKRDFAEKVFGQHLVQKVVIRSLKSHLSKKQPKKALLMSFHGWTGSGKNLVSTLIAKNLFHKGAKSSFYKLYVGSRDFAIKEEVNKYRQILRTDIEAATALCERNLFVFDEVDKMAPGILDVVYPYADVHEVLRGHDYRKNIFIFLSNSGGNNITSVALDFWADGKEREHIELKDIERVISMDAFNEAGGLQHSDIIKKELMDTFVPFLPLEKKHIRDCIITEVKARNLTVDKDVVKNIANQLLYFPSDTELFSTSGCKKISHKVDLFYEDEE